MSRKNGAGKRGSALRGKAGTAALTGILAALALSFSFLEGLLPPVPGTPPGFKLGLSNIVSMYAAGSLGLPCALFLAFLKGGSAFFTRGITAGLMSLSGGLLSTLCVWLLWRKTDAPLMLRGGLGALSHNAAQLACACILTSASALFYVPFLLLFGILTGILTGTVLKLTLPLLEGLNRFFQR